MASSLFFKPAGSKEIGMVSLYAYIDIGGTGAPTLNVSKSKGVASIARNSAGNYTITLSENYNSLLWADMMLLSATSRDLTFQILAEAVQASKTVQFVVHAAATATDPTSGDVVIVKLDLKNSGV